MATTYIQPRWWNGALHGTAWARVRDAMRADWEDRTPPAGTVRPPERSTVGRIATPRVEPTPRIPDREGTEWMSEDPRGSARIQRGMMRADIELGRVASGAAGWEDLPQSEIVSPHLRRGKP